MLFTCNDGNFRKSGRLVQVAEIAPELLMAEIQGQSTGTGLRRLNNRSQGGMIDTETDELEPTISPENNALDSERRSYELTRRQVQMMAFGITRFFRFLMLKGHPWEPGYFTGLGLSYISRDPYPAFLDILLWVPSSTLLS